MISTLPIHLHSSVFLKLRKMSSTELASLQKSEAILRALSQVASDGDKFRDGDPTARAKLVKSARQLVAAAESPVETLLWNTWALVWTFEAVVYINCQADISILSLLTMSLHGSP